jgi:hypothetical protein
LLEHLLDEKEKLPVAGYEKSKINGFLVLLTATIRDFWARPALVRTGYTPAGTFERQRLEAPNVSDRIRTRTTGFHQQNSRAILPWKAGIIAIRLPAC